MTRFPRVLAAALAITLMLTATCAQRRTHPGNIGQPWDGSRPEPSRYAT